MGAGSVGVGLRRRLSALGLVPALATLFGLAFIAQGVGVSLSPVTPQRLKAILNGRRDL